MGELEPRDSRIVTQNPSATPGEPERTGPREGAKRGQPAPGDRQELPAEKKIGADTEDRWQVDPTSVGSAKPRATSGRE